MRGAVYKFQYGDCDKLFYRHIIDFKLVVVGYKTFTGTRPPVSD